MITKEMRSFWILCLAMFLSIVSFNLIMPELNHFITTLGGENHKGLIIVLFSISAAASRPFAGKLSDTIGRKKVIYIGISICLIVDLLYSSVTSLAFFLLLRFFNGFSAGFFPTGATALIADILPLKFRAIGMGIWGTAISLGIGAAQISSSFICKHVGITNLFLISSGFSALSLLFVTHVTESLPNPQRFNRKFLDIKLKDIFEPHVLPAAIVMFLTATCSGIIFVLTSDMCVYLAIPNKGTFFGVYVISTIITRLFSLRLSDKIGRRMTLIIGVSLLIISMLLIAYAYDITSFSIAAIIFGVSIGLSSPTLYTWTADLSPPDRIGVGTGTLFLSLELGVIFGSSSTMFIYNNTHQSIPTNFLFGTSMAVLAATYLIWHIKSRASLT
jgi:MFS family permease